MYCQVAIFSEEECPELYSGSHPLIVGVLIEYFEYMSDYYQNSIPLTDECNDLLQQKSNYFAYRKNLLEELKPGMNIFLLSEEKEDIKKYYHAHTDGQRHLLDDHLSVIGEWLYPRRDKIIWKRIMKK